MIHLICTISDKGVFCELSGIRSGFFLELDTDTIKSVCDSVDRMIFDNPRPKGSYRVKVKPVFAFKSRNNSTFDYVAEFDQPEKERNHE